MRLESASRSDVGRRSNNEDACCAELGVGLFAVADGVGGYEGGEVASQLTIATLLDFFRRNAADAEATWPFKMDLALTFTENLLRVGARIAHLAICARRIGRLESMGSTLVALASRGPEAVIAHVGDSRAYRLRRGSIEQLTRDHSLYEQMRASGGIQGPKSSFAYANVITRALGMPGDASVDLTPVTLEPGDVYLLCSDGLSDPLPEAAIARLLDSSEARAACDSLLTAAYEAGGKDNITAVVVRVLADQPSTESSPEPSPGGSRSP